MAAVLVSKSDFDLEDGLGKPSIASVSSRTDLSHEKKAISAESLSNCAE